MLHRIGASIPPTGFLSNRIWSSVTWGSPEAERLAFPVGSGPIQGYHLGRNRCGVYVRDRDCDREMVLLVVGFDFLRGKSYWDRWGQREDGVGMG